MAKTGRHILAIDQGTTSSRAIIFDADLRILGIAQEEFEQHFPQSGWVEHEVEDLWSTTLATCRKALGDLGLAPADIAAIGITNQRETTLVWDKRTGRAVTRAIVWQDRRTSDYCRGLKDEGHEEAVTARSGLLLDPYFSATKLNWILENVEGARGGAEKGDLLFGTVDSYLIWRLTGGAEHVTDATNAARTMLYNIHEGRWDDALLDLFSIPRGMLPEVRDCSGEFGTTAGDVFDGAAIPILGVAGDQQAATVGQAGFTPGMIKSTYGTGCFALMNTGDRPAVSKSKLLTTIAYQLGGKPVYALEGSIFIAGAVVQWLRDGLKIIESAGETAALAEASSAEERLYLVPAFTGLGAPHWDPDCRGAVFGLTRNSGPADFVRAALESVAYQTRDLIEAMHRDSGGAGDTVLRIDGGMAANDWAMQTLADQLSAPVDRPAITETTALGAAYLAGLAAGICPAPEEFAGKWELDRRFEPAITPEEAAERHLGWREAVARLLHDPSLR